MNFPKTKTIKVKDIELDEIQIYNVDDMEQWRINIMQFLRSKVRAMQQSNELDFCKETQAFLDGRGMLSTELLRMLKK